MVGCGAALLRLQSVLDGRAGDHAPSFRAARETLQTVRALVERFGGKPEPKPAPVEAKATQQAAGPAATEAVVATVVGPIRSRAQALDQLREVAEFFRQTEPRSPVAYLAARAAKWGDMPLHAWLRTVVKDDATLSQIEELLGLGDPSPDNAS